MHSINKENEFDFFCRKHNARQIYPVKKMLEKYPSLRLYGFKTAIKEWVEHHFSDYDIYEGDRKKHFSKSYLYPHFLPDLYLVTDEVILLFEIEDYSVMTKEKINRIYNWIGWCDMEFEPEIVVYGFDRFANFQRVLLNCIGSEEDALEWLLELDSTPNYKNQNIKRLELNENRQTGESGFVVYDNKPNIGYCKQSKLEINYNNELEKTTEGSIYY